MISPLKKKRFKTRFLAFLTVVLVFVPFLGLSAFAYPAQNWIPSNRTVAFGASSSPIEYSTIWETVQTAELQTGVPNTLTFGNLVLSMADLTQPWNYVSFQADVSSNGSPLGHYTCGFYRENGGELHMRLGRTNINDLAPTYPVDIVVEYAASFLFDFTLEKLTDGTTQMRIEAFSLDSEERVIDSGVFAEIMPVYVDTVYFGGKTQYARANSVSLIGIADSVPHSARELIANDILYKRVEASGFDDGEEYGYGIGYDAGYNSAASDGANTFDNMGKLIWTIVDMPFVLVTQVLNFEIFGVNMTDMVLGLLTIGLVVFILGKVGVFA